MLSDVEFDFFCQYINTAGKAETAAAIYHRRCATLRALEQSASGSAAAARREDLEKQSTLTLRARAAAQDMAREAAAARSAWLALCPN